MKYILANIAIFALTVSVRAAFYTNSTSADAFVRSNAPTLNYGGAGSLSVSGPTATNGFGAANGASDSFLRFNTAAMVASFNSQFGPGNWSITSAKLQVTEQSAPPNAIFNRGLSAFEIRWIANDNWTEGTGNPASPQAVGIKYNDEPSVLNPNADISLGTFTNVGADNTLLFSLPLPAALTADIKAGGDVGFFLTATDTATGFTFYSRSFTTNSLRPFLIVTALPMPVITSVNLAAANVALTVTNGVTGVTYQILTATNLSLPIAQWTSMATNVPIGENFYITATNTMSGGQQFFILQTQ
jgi:hypothetical protein